MPKFSAYMKGSDGSQGPAGASIIDGILVNEDSLPQQAGHGKHAYLVGTTDPKNLWVWDEENSEWKDQGPIANRIGEVTATMNAIPWTTTAIPSVQTQFSTSNQIDSLNFDFTIPFLDNAYDVINNKVNRDGDTMTGDLIISQSSSLYIQQPGNAYTDSNFSVGRTTKTYIGNTYNNDGYTRTGIIQENANGSKEYFRLPISYSTENDNTYDILTNKALVTVGQGGTGVSTATANYVFAAPATNNGSPDFRQLVANDIPDLNANKITDGILNVNRIPDLNASKITDGILPIERGGTNATNAADARANLDVLNKSGDTFNGDFTLPIGNKIKTGDSVYSFITSQAGNNSSNPTVLIQAGGNLLLSGGEFASNALSADLDSSSTGGENLYLGSDGNVYLYSNGNTVANAKKWAFTNTGETQLPSALSIAYGGTSLTTNPSVLVKLDSTSAADIFAASPRPGITGTLTVAHGGTGKTTHTANAILTGNGTDAINNIATASGAFYATKANGVAQFGTLPTGQGGTGNTNGTVAKLTTARKISTNLASTVTASFDGSADITPGVSGILGTGNGGTGNVNGTVAKLTTARNIHIDLAKTTAASFNGSADITPGVTGTLGTGNGGTGNTEGKAATAVKLAQKRRFVTYLANKYDSNSDSANYTGQWDLSGNTNIPVYGTLGVANGGTSVTTYDDLRTKLGFGAMINTEPEAVSVPTGGYATIGSVTVPKGTSLFTAVCYFSSNKNGKRQFFFTNSNSATNAGSIFTDTRTAIDGAAIILRLVFLITLTKETTYYFRAYQDSGSAINATLKCRQIQVDS